MIRCSLVWWRSKWVSLCIKDSPEATGLLPWDLLTCFVSNLAVISILLPPWVCNPTSPTPCDSGSPSWQFPHHSAICFWCVCCTCTWHIDEIHGLYTCCSCFKDDAFMAETSIYMLQQMCGCSLHHCTIENLEGNNQMWSLGVWLHSTWSIHFIHSKIVKCGPLGLAEGRSWQICSHTQKYKIGHNCQEQSFQSSQNWPKANHQMDDSS